VARHPRLGDQPGRAVRPLALGEGFNYFYGFQGGETHQYYPQLYRNSDPVEPKTTPEQGYHLTPDITGEAVAWIQKHCSVAPDQSRFSYFAPGAMHAPHHAPKEHIAKFKGKFDMGWDKFREMAFENQKKLGVVPADCKLTPRPKDMPSWDSRSDDEKKLYARQMEAFAGFLAHLDDNLGRLFDAVAAGPDADNTLIICVAGDYGCSPEGGLTGTLNNMATQNGFPDDVKTMLRSLDEIGGPKHENNFSVCWAWAVDAPFQWTKAVASHFGGARTGTIISWPAKIKDGGTFRTQFHHVIDIAPTIYEAAGIAMPDLVNGVKQVPLAGVSMVYTFADAKAAERRKTQYFEIFGNRGVYHDGWFATARHGLPWVLLGRKGDFENDQWELYDLSKDFGQADDVAAKFPDKLKELKGVFEVEAKKYGVFPLDDRFAERGGVPDRPSHSRGRTTFTYYPGAVRIPEGSAPNVKARSHKITAELEIPAAGAEGVIVCAGGSAGYSLFVKNGKPMYENNFFGKERDLIQSEKPLPKGKIAVAFEYTHESKEYGGGGTGRLFVNGERVGEGKFKHVVPVRYSATETFDVGEDRGEAVSAQYKGPFKFTGKLVKVTVELK
jgi:arylsulfatase